MKNEAIIEAVANVSNEVTNALDAMKTHVLELYKVINSGTLTEAEIQQYHDEAMEAFGTWWKFYCLAKDEGLIKGGYEK